MIEWRFKPNSRDDMDVDPIQGEFFTTRDINNISTAVVREGIQNALDERNRENSNMPVKVRIFLSGEKYGIMPKDFIPYIKTLLPHLSAKDSGLSELPDFDKKMKFLLFEDFNTKGLEGDPAEFYKPNNKDDEFHNYYYFWRNVGRSGKSDDNLGRWGLGKTVFPASSRINTFWGLTIRNSDRRKMLMGQSILRIHNREDDKKQEAGFRPYGMYGKFTGNDFFALPIEDENEISNFEQLFRIARNGLPGFSLIVPFVTNEINVNHLTYAVIEQYFFPILEGRLEVDLIDEDYSISLTKNSIKDSIDKIDFEVLDLFDDKKIRNKESLLKLFDFTSWTQSIHEDLILKLLPLPLSHKPKWSKLLLENGELPDIIKENFEYCERLAFKVPLKYHPVGKEEKVCWFHCYLEKDSSLVKPESLFVRDGITITGISSLDKGLVRGLVIIHDTDLSRLLGDSENPAHTEWQKDSRNFKGKYNDGEESIAFVKNSLKKLYEFLQRPIEGLQKDLLIDFFSIPLESTETKKPENLPDDSTSGEDDTVEPELKNLNGKTRPILVEKLASGLRIYKNPLVSELKESYLLKLGYDVPRGNPVNSYQELDFDVSKSPISIVSEGVYFLKKEKNELHFEIENELVFEIKLTGFDEKRDLFIKIN